MVPCGLACLWRWKLTVCIEGIHSESLHYALTITPVCAWAPCTQSPSELQDLLDVVRQLLQELEQPQASPKEGGSPGNSAPTPTDDFLQDDEFREKFRIVKVGAELLVQLGGCVVPQGAARGQVRLESWCGGPHERIYHNASPTMWYMKDLEQMPS